MKIACIAPSVNGAEVCGVWTFAHGRCLKDKPSPRIEIHTLEAARFVVKINVDARYSRIIRRFATEIQLTSTPFASQ
jgi:hypothetical protein